MRDRALMVAAALVVCGAGATAPAGAATRLPLAAQPMPRIGDAILQPPRTRQSTFSDPVVAGPPVSRPTSGSCKVTLIQNYMFNNFTPATGSYAPPAACPGPWSKVVLDWTVSVSGVQFDRLGAIWLGGTEIFHFTTSEPPGPQITWHVAKDVTEYANTFQTASDYTVSLGNVVNGTYTGIYDSTATLTFYKVDKSYPAAKVPDIVAPISQYPTASPPWFTLNTPSNQASATLNLPTNIDDASLEVYTTGHGCDEFWYAQESSAYEQSIGQTCGGSAYREIDVWLDNQLVGIVDPFPYLYTGAIDPILWLPVTGHDTLNIPPYKVDLSPWVGVLTNGQPHTVAVSVFNNFGYWVADADLLLTLDHGMSATSGKLTHYFTGNPAKIEHIDEKHLTPAGGYATYTARHLLVAEGYVETLHGRIHHKVKEDLNFTNFQRLNNTTEAFFVNSNGALATTSETRAQGAGDVTTTTDEFPLKINLTLQVNIAQSYFESVVGLSGRTPSQATTSDQITARTIAGKPTQTADHLVINNNGTDCWDQLLTASNGALTGNAKQNRCEARVR